MGNAKLPLGTGNCSWVTARCSVCGPRQMTQMKDTPALINGTLLAHMSLPETLKTAEDRDTISHWLSTRERGTLPVPRPLPRSGARTTQNNNYFTSN